MKKIIFPLILSIAFLSAYACPLYGVQINYPVNLQNAFMNIVQEARYYELDESSIKYFSLDSDEIAVQISEENIFISVVSGNENKDFDFQKIIYEELSWLNSKEATDFSETDVISISELECCGFIEHFDGEWGINYPDCTGTGMELVRKNTSFNWVAVLVSFVPALFFLALYAKGKKGLWIASLIGGIGFVVSYLVGELPRAASGSIFGRGLNIGYILSASIIAGVVEEGIRYLIFKKVKQVNPEKEHAVSLGLGWGIAEALLIYAGVVISNILIINYPITFLELLPGAFERNFAVIIHVAYSLIVMKAVANRKYLYIAMAGHAAVDFIAINLLLLTTNVIAIEGAIGIMSIAVLGFALAVNRKKKK
ncbi:MAG: YhfC family glutamic-type intramembrane protease [Candidatus Nanoarchaeia archaeon]|nr:YhfC family glutamic-type intramembrane protease [Candidatus Nanoarchaeia archaeon]